MIDNQQKQLIKSKVDLISLLNKDTALKRVATTDGGEWAGPCPVCGGRDRFRVWPNSPKGPHFWCREGGGNGCGFRGDCFTYAMRMERLTFAQAVRFCADFAGLNIEVGERYDPGRRPAPIKPAIHKTLVKPLTPPNHTRQERGRIFVAECQHILWTAAGKPGLDNLLGRGLIEQTIRESGLGYYPQQRFEPLVEWGFNKEDTDSKAIFLPQGIVIPYFGNNQLWRIEVRFLKPEMFKGEMRKTLSILGSVPYLYGADRLRSDKPAILVEGVIDYLSILQCASDLITPVATGGTTLARHEQLVKLMLRPPLVLVSFDNDGDDGFDGQHATKGHGAAQWWTQRLPNAKRWWPTRKDVNEMLMAGVDVRAWIEASLRKYYRHHQMSEREVYYL